MMPKQLTPLDTSPKKQGERGKKNKGLKKRWSPRKTQNCKKTCPIYGRCFFQGASIEKYKGKCGLANTPMSDLKKNSIIKTLIGGEGEIFEVMRELLVDLKLLAKNDFNKKERVFGCYDKLSKTEFGQKIDASIGVYPMTLEEKIKEMQEIEWAIKERESERKQIEGEVEENENNKEENK